MTKPYVDMYLPIEQAIYVPSTKNNKPIPTKQFNARVETVRKYLSQKFGGFTSVRASGGYYSSKEKKVINEPVAKVTSFGQKEKYIKYRKPLLSKIATWQKQWSQESVGYEKEGDLLYITGVKPKPKKKVIKRRVAGRRVAIKTFVFNPTGFRR